MWEESGVKVGSVTLFDSQPWPVGRGGQCELMIGCMARVTDAACETISLNADEMEDVQWVTVDDAADMLRHPYRWGAPMDASPTENRLPFTIPGPYGLAFHLIKEFVRSHSLMRSVVEEVKPAQSILDDARDGLSADSQQTLCVNRSPAFEKKIALYWVFAGGVIFGVFVGMLSASSLHKLNLRALLEFSPQSCFK